MIRQGTTLQSPDGERMVIRETCASTNGTIFSFESFIPTTNSKPIKHYHPHQQETLTVAEGIAAVDINGTVAHYTAGQILEIPKGTKHTIWAEGDKELHAIFEFRPALNSEEYFAKSMHVKSVFQHANLLNNYSDEIRLIFPFSLIFKILSIF